MELDLRERHRDEPGRVRASDLQQHAVLAGRFRLRQLGADVADIGDGLAADIEDDVAGLDAALRRRPLRIDLGDDDALLAAPCTSPAGAKLSPRRGVPLPGCALPSSALP
ncbi:hypothetical protein ACVINX_005408 [Bradyrhizobium diazoefficiens]